MATLAELRQAQLQEATFSLTNGATNLTQVIIDRLLFEATRKYVPLKRALPRQRWLSKDYRFNSRLALPQAQATTEAPAVTDVAATNSTYTQGVYPIKHTQVQLDIAKFSAEVANVNGNLYDLELMGAAKSMAYLEEMFHLYGNAASTLNTKRPQWDGIDMQVANVNKVDAAGQTVSPKLLDNLIDSITSVSAEELGDNYFFVMGNRMQSALNQAFIAQERFNVSTTRMFARDDYGFPGGTIDDNGVDAGIELQSYRGIPIVKSSFLGNVGQMGAIGISAGAVSGSVLPAATYYYVVEAVTSSGVSQASTEVSQAATSGQGITLTWSTPTIIDALGQATSILSYRIYRSNASGTETLYAVLSARDVNDAYLTSFVDSGVVPTPGAGVYYVTFNQNAGVAIPDGYTYPRTPISSKPVQNIFLIPRNPDYCVVPVFKEITTVPLAPVNARSTQFALISDLTLALRAPNFASKLERVCYQ